MVSFRPVARSLGAEVEGVDLSSPLNQAVAAQLKEGFLQHEVLFFRDQRIQRTDQLALAELFGKPVVHPAYPTAPDVPVINILENKKEIPPKIDTWHTDMTFQEKPPLGSVLRGMVIPEKGGDTMWASLSAAYDGLSARMKQYLSGLKAEHSFTFGFRHSLAEEGGTERLAQAVLDNPPRLHPVIRTHPESGKQAIFVNRLFTTRIVGVSEAESEAILNYLFAHIETPEFTCRFRWQANSIAFWDNRITLHRPVNDFWPADRVMERITIEGDVPV